MKLFSLSVRNIFVNWRRSLSLGLFTFMITVLLIVFNSSVMTIKNNMIEALASTLTGEIIIRSAKDTGDIFTLKKSWDELYYIKSGQTAVVADIIENRGNVAEYTERVRLNGLLGFKKEKVPAIIIGIDPRLESYKKYFKLVKGRYLSPYRSNEIVLSEEHAKSLKVDVGSILEMDTQIKEGMPAKEYLRVVGIGKLDLLLSISIAYMDIRSAKGIMKQSGFSGGEISDILVYMKDDQAVEQSALILSESLEKAGITSDMVTVSTYKNMGGFIMGTISLYVLLLYGFIGLLMLIVSILIVNLVYMMGLERRQEIGTLRAIGFSKLRIVSIFINEIAAITGAASVAGIVAGVAVVSVLERHGFKAGPPLSFITGSEFYMKLDKAGILIVVLIIFAFSIGASLYPSYRAASLRPVEALEEA